MAIHVAVEHRTVYRFDRLVSLEPHVLRLRPAPHCRTPVTAYSLTVSPENHFINWQQDAFGNHLARLVFPEKASELSIVVDVLADMTVINPFDFFVESTAEQFPFAYDAQLALDLEPYLRPVHDGVGPLVRRWLADLPPIPESGTRTVNFLFDLNKRLCSDVQYAVRLETGVQTPEETLQIGVGSCRDSAWLLVAILRELGLAARFASGYLIQLAPDIAALDGPAGPAQDFTDLHAWAEVYLPGAGWVGMDPTSGLFAGEGHIPLACTPHPSSAAPVTGALEPCEVSLDFSNTVRRIREDPRVTKPYDQAQWTAIDALGRRVDQALADGDVRLTMGGEPTFVSIDDMESAQWNTASDGPDKRRLAAELAHRLTRSFAPHGLVSHGQGKWYPGEPLPRWQITTTWRTDGRPLWSDRSLLADPGTPGDATGETARLLAVVLAARLGVPAARCLPAYEDPLHRTWQEARLPDGDPEPLADGDDADSRRALAAAADSGHGQPTGWVIPLHRDVKDDTRWATSKWRMRRGRLFLTPGDSPVGLRLPLDSISWQPPPGVPERSPFEPRGDLPEAAEVATGDVRPARDVPVGQAPPTALCVQVRHGHVHVFLPPLEKLEHAVELLATLEAAAARLGRPVVIEGYPLPSDPRATTLAVTPDPGVIEVNMQPAASWAELTGITTTLYEQTRLTRLGTEKFGLDGAHGGTGGGNHMTLGGPTAADSPLLRRPDLLRSMITYWQHHPSLSYLFSGRFIGPTSQAPRVDEGRHENLYELEIAFAEMERLGRQPPSWLVDRLLRHLLVDITGNTHRAEFCIDKLFSPDSERGRLGLVEMRSFEMPPHPRMALVQALLVRALVARFWAAPYAAPLVRWGTELHDRHLLPWFVRTDVDDVVGDLRAHGFDFEPSWLDPFMEFRFPRLGTVDVAGTHIELRAAIEPWHVLGEETSSGATSRFVDSSVERLQVQVSGLTPERHVVTCNGHPVPLHPTGVAGTFVAGVRYRAWQPHSALHPTIAVHTPLVFDLLDRWSARSLGGCTYHVAHPGGRAYDRFPVNANEAEARRSSRFVPYGHTPGDVDRSGPAFEPPRAGSEYRWTLDLRRVRAV